MLNSLDALEVTLDLLEAVVDTLVEMSVNFTGRWNRDTVAQATSQLKGAVYIVRH